MVEVAQLVEHQIVVLVVAGSSPVLHPKLYPYGDIKGVYSLFYTRTGLYLGVLQMATLPCLGCTGPQVRILPLRLC